MNVFILGVPHKGSSSLLASPYMEKELRLLGITPTVMAVNDEAQLTAAIRQIVMLGGLVLTPLTGKANIDRLLSDSMAKACGLPLEQNEEVFEQLAQRNVKLTREEVAQLSTLPKGAQVYAFHDDGYPAYQVDGENIHAILLPADPAEQSAVFLNTVFPTFAQQPKYPCASHTIRVMELSAAEVEGALKDALITENPCIAVYPGKEETIVRVSVRAQAQEQAASACQSAAKTVLERLGSYVYGVDVPNIERALLQRLEKKQLHLALAESGSKRRGEQRLVKCKKADSVELYFPQENSPAVEAAKAQYGAVSLQTACAMAASGSASNRIGVAVVMPTARERAASAYVAACFSGHTLSRVIPISGFKDVQQLSDACVSHGLNLARKFADSHPTLPKGAVAAIAAPAAIPKEETTSMPSEEKQSLPKRILGAIFPTKADPTKEKLRKLGLILCLCVFCGSVGYLMDHHQQGVNAQETNKELSNMKEDFKNGNLDNYEIDEEKLAEVAPEVLDEYKPFVAINDDMQGWVQIDGTNLAYPVVQAKDNEYYSRLNFQGEYDYYGIPYLDFECRLDIDPEKTSDNLVIYGHNIGNDGLAFNPLSYYKQLNFYKEHPVVRFDSIYKEQEYKIFGVMVTNAQPEQDNGNVFNYHQMVDFDDEEEFNAFISEVRRRSMWDIDVDVQYGDKLLTLSTCCYDFRPEARCVVLARAIREGEDRNVDTSTAVQNVDAYFPQAYLDAMKEKAKYGKVKGIAIQGDDEYILEVGQTLQLSAVTTPADAPINTARWESSASAVATVDPASGFITALTPGEATITARADDGGYVDTVKVIVRAKNALEGLYFGGDLFTVAVGKELKLTVYAEPEDAALELTWSGDSDCFDAYVNKSNQRELYITGLEATTEPAAITVTDKLTGLSASCYVSVVDENAKISVPGSLNVQSGVPAYLNLTVSPASSTSLVVKRVDYWEDDNITVSGPSAGNGVLTYTVTMTGEPGESGDIEFYLDDDSVGSCTVTIVAGNTPANPNTPGNPTNPSNPNAPEKITIVNEFGQTLNGNTFDLDSDLDDVMLILTGATDYKWTSTNPKAAYVDEYGFLCIEGAGTATITVTGPNGGTAQFTINVDGGAQPPKQEEQKPSETPEEPEVPEEEEPEEEPECTCGGGEATFGGVVHDEDCPLYEED